MLVTKRNSYAETFDLCGIDTLSGYIPRELSTAELQNSANFNKFYFDEKKQQTYVLINPNKNTASAERLITSYSEFIEKLTAIMQGIGASLDELRIVRADFCINSTDIYSYGAFGKLHKALILCLAECYSVRNCYNTFDLWTGASISVAIKADAFEVENYDKRHQSEGQDECANRLELRAKRIDGGNIQEQFMLRWYNRLDRAKECFVQMQEHINSELSKIYIEDLKKPQKDKDFISLTAFLLRYKNDIFTRKQLIDLLRKIGINNAAHRADKFKECHRIEYFSQKDLDFVVRCIKEKISKYFNQ